VAVVFDRIDHVGIAVDELEPAIELWRDRLGMQLSHREVVADQGVEAALLDVGENHIELLAPLSPDTAVGKFLAKRGPGLHHVAYQVQDIDATLEAVRRAGLALIDEQPRTGLRGSRVAFLRPGATARVLVEIVQPVGAGADGRAAGTAPAAKEPR
jgi:methylmalonyl-CoA epimerase